MNLEREIKLIFLIASLSYSCFAQTMFMRTYGDTGYDGATAIPTYDQGYALFCKKGFNPSEILLIKTDSLGDTLWTKIYTGSNGCSGPWDFAQTLDSGFIFTGAVIDSNFSPYTQPVLVRLNAMGDTLWTKAGYGTGQVFQTNDGGFAIYNSYVFTKLDANGNFQWAKRYSTEGFQAGWTEKTNDGGYIISGQTRIFSTAGPPNDLDIHLIKIDSIGNVQWSKAYGDSLQEFSGMVTQTFTGDYIITGSTLSFGAGSDDILFFKVDQLGDTLWAHTFGGPYDDWGSYQAQTSGSPGYVLTGQTTGFSIADDSATWGNYRAYMIKTDYNGNFVWGNRYGKGPNDNGGRVYRTSDNGFIYSGSTGGWGAGYTDGWLIKTNALGDAGCYTYSTTPIITRPILKVRSTTLNPLNISRTPFHVPVNINQNTNTSLSIICTTDPTGMNDPGPSSLASILLYPNPASGYFTLIVDNLGLNCEVSLYNLLGQKVGGSVTKEKNTEFDLSGYPKGLYLVQIRIKDLLFTKKIILE